MPEFASWYRRGPVPVYSECRCAAKPHYDGGDAWASHFIQSWAQAIAVVHVAASAALTPDGSPRSNHLQSRSMPRVRPREIAGRSVTGAWKPTRLILTPCSRTDVVVTLERKLRRPERGHVYRVTGPRVKQGSPRGSALASSAGLASAGGAVQMRCPPAAVARPDHGHVYRVVCAPPGVVCAPPGR